MVSRNKCCIETVQYSHEDCDRRHDQDRRRIREREQEIAALCAERKDWTDANAELMAANKAQDEALRAVTRERNELLGFYIDDLPPDMPDDEWEQFDPRTDPH